MHEHGLSCREPGTGTTRGRSWRVGRAVDWQREERRRTREEWSKDGENDTGSTRSNENNVECQVIM